MKQNQLIEDLQLIPLPPWWQSPWALFAFALVLIILVVLGLWTWRLWASRRLPKLQSVPQPDRTPDFLARLTLLRSRKAELDAYSLAIQCSDLLREFVEWRFRMAIRFQTTREFLETAVHDTSLVPEQRDQLGHYLRFCDLVKFAQQGATGAERDHLLDTAEAFLRSEAIRANRVQEQKPS